MIPDTPQRPGPLARIIAETSGNALFAQDIFNGDLSEIEPPKKRLKFENTVEFTRQESMLQHHGVEYVIISDTQDCDCSYSKTPNN